MRVHVDIEPINQAFVASFELPLLGPALSLRSDWTDGRPVDRRWSLADLPPDAEVTVQIADRELVFNSDHDGTAQLEWDGRDASGAPIGPSIATLEIEGETRRMRLGRWDARQFGLGGLLVRGHDHLDVVGRRIQLGSGRSRRSVVLERVGAGWKVPMAQGRRHAHFDADGFLERVAEVAGDRTVLTSTRVDGALRSISWRGGALEFEPTVDGFVASTAGRRIHASFGDDGRLVGLRGPTDGEVTIAWQDGLLRALTDPAGFTHAFDYDDDGRLVEFSRPGCGVTRLVRTSTERGHRVLVLSPEGRESSYEVERMPDGTKVRTTRCCGKPPRTTRIAGPRIEVEVGDGTRISTDRRTGLRQTTLPSGLTRERVQTPDGVTVNGEVWRWDRGPAGTVSTSPEGRAKGIRLDGDAATVFNGGDRTVLHRDEHGRAVRVVQGDQSWDIEHDDAGRLTRAVSADGFEASMEYDDAGWLVGQRLPGDRTIAIGRADNGTVRSFTAPGNRTTQIETASPGQVAAIRFPSDSVDGRPDELRFDHDADGLVVGTRYGSEPTLDFIRDEAGLLVEARMEGRPMSTRRHEHGRPVAATTAAGQRTSMTWDGPLLTSMTQEGIVTGTVHRSHDVGFQVHAISSGQLGVQVQHDRDGITTSLGPAELEHDERGRLVAIRAGVVVRSWERDTHGRTTATQIEADGERCWRVEYSYDQHGRIARLVDSRFPEAVPAEFSYDQAGRLVGATGPFPFEVSWDPNGNPVSWRREETVHRGEFDASDRLHRLDGALVEHDGAGRLRSASDATGTLTYDPFGRLASITGPDAGGATGTTRLTRDGFGSIVMLARDGHEPVHLLPGPHGHPDAVVDADGTTQVLFAGGSATAPPVLAVERDRTLFIGCDHLGTVRLVIDIETGVIVDERVHDHWGSLIRRTGRSAVPFGWGCGLLDLETDVVHFPARSYSPALLRFVSRDPLLFRGRSTNLYAFAGGDPVNHGDPTGTTQICRRVWQRWRVPGTDIKEDWEHWWVKDDQGNELGYAEDPDSTWNELPLPGEQGRAQDHAGQTGECDEVEDVDDECVRREVARREGEDLGFWGPGSTCQDFVDDILSSCANDGDYTVVTDNPDAYDNSYGPSPNTRAPADEGPYTPADGDGGYTPADGEYTPLDGGGLWD